MAKKADYLFSLKENHERLYEDVKEYFEGLDFFALGKRRGIYSMCLTRRLERITTG